MCLLKKSQHFAMIRAQVIDMECGWNIIYIAGLGRTIGCPISLVNGTTTDLYRHASKKHCLHIDDYVLKYCGHTLRLDIPLKRFTTMRDESVVHLCLLLRGGDIDMSLKSLSILSRSELLCS